MKSIQRSTHPILMYTPSNGDVKTDDGKYVFVGNVYGTNIHKDPANIQELLRIFPRLTARQVETAADGVYTWLLYSVDDSDVIQFVCTEVVSPFEIGTRHQSMAYNARVQASKLYGGGEFVKTGENIRFNILSGTYSKPLVQYTFDKSITKQIVSSFKVFFPTAEYDDSGDSYIHTITNVSNEILEIYKRFGYIVLTFDTYTEWSAFQTMFWNLDFNIEHYKKKVETATDEDMHIMRTLYIDSLQRMMELLEKASAKAHGVRKTRKTRRKHSIR